jgi:hypothetical protein
MATTAPKKHNSRWSSTEIATLKSMVLAGKNSSEIANTLGRTRASVMGKKASMNWGSRLRITRGKNSGHLAPMTAGTKPRYKSDHNVHSSETQSKLEFDDFTGTIKNQLKADKKKAFKKVEKATKDNKKTSDVGTLVSQLKAFAKQSGLKLKITFEN